MADGDGSSAVTEAGSALGSAQDALRALAERESDRHPIVIGLVAPLGVPLDPVQAGLAEALRTFGYGAHEIRLSKLLDDSPYRPWGDLPGRDNPDYYKDRMGAGDRLRRETASGAALAALAVAKVGASRAVLPAETAFVLRGLKHPDEVALLRHVYGESFALVAVTSSAEERRDDLAEHLSLFGGARSDAERLIERDEADASEPDFGQNVRGTFSKADAYLATGRGLDPIPAIRRILDALFGDPFLTPYPEEEGMRFAFDASLRSAAVGRQVGAALVPKIGTPVVVGTNEVPKPGGGQYWTGDEPDFRDFRTGVDPNPKYVRGLVEEILVRLQGSGWLKDSYDGLEGSELAARAMSKDADGKSVVSGSRASALIEFVRCLHAEQAAIVNAARAGVSTEGAVLYSTAFPCHECAKAIIGAGISTVYYIEPYPKSLVDRLYRDLINTEPAVSGSDSESGRLPFRPFIGLAPRRYAAAFTGDNRQDGTGLASFDRLSARPVASWNEPGIRSREFAVASALFRIFEALDPSLVGLVQELEDPPVGAGVDEAASEPADAAAESGDGGDSTKSDSG